MKRRYLNYHGLCLFFQNLDDFCDFCREAKVDFNMDPQLYGDLFYGTDSDIYIPLWASVAKTEEDVLLNNITLEVIKFYKSFGYEAINMDGNPADFVGEQLRFLEYLSACALNGSMAHEDADKAITEFENEFLIDTLHMIQIGINKYADSPATSFISEFMECIISGNYYPWQIDETPEISKWQRHAPIEVEESHIVSFASCCDCGSKCKMLATVSEGCLLEINPDTYGTEFRFVGCPRGRAYGHTYLTSKRLRFPMERVGERGDGKFRRISWEEAAKKIAHVTSEAGKKYGPGSRFVINAAGVSAAVRGDRFMKNLLACDGGYLNYYNYYSAACTVYTIPYVYGQVVSGNHESTYVDSNLIIFWGHNPATCHYGLGTKDYFMQAKENGAKIVVIDPRMSDTVITMADQWIPIKPSSDTAMIDAMAYVIWSEGLQDQDFMDKFCIRWHVLHPAGSRSRRSLRAALFRESSAYPTKTENCRVDYTGMLPGPIFRRDVPDLTKWGPRKNMVL